MLETLRRAGPPLAVMIEVRWPYGVEYPHVPAQRRAVQTFLQWTRALRSRVTR
jgi:hypothetical protein